jgi:hypothetical protein
MDIVSSPFRRLLPAPIRQAALRRRQIVNTALYNRNVRWFVPPVLPLGIDIPWLFGR